MPYVIDEIRRLLQDDRRLHVVTHHWPDAGSHAAGDPPALLNCFHFPPFPTLGKRLLRDAQNRVRRIADRGWVDLGAEVEAAEAAADGALATQLEDARQYESETFPYPVRDEIVAAIARFIRRADAHSYTGDRTCDPQGPQWIDGVEIAPRDYSGRGGTLDDGGPLLARTDISALSGPLRSVEDD